MSSDKTIILPDESFKGFSSENLDIYLQELAKEYKKIVGKTTPAEVILVGGASILARYGFRESTSDVDAYVRGTSAMKEASNKVGDRYHLANGWFNSDFVQTKSFSPKLEQYSQYYKTYSNVVEFRTVTGEYLIAMKLMSGRPHKSDLSDIVGILISHIKEEKPISYSSIEKAIKNLYGNIENLPKESIVFLKGIFSSNGQGQDFSQNVEKLETLWLARIESEQNALQSLITFEHKYKNVLNEDNIGDILKTITERNTVDELELDL